MKDRYELCEDHKDAYIFYDYRLMCPLCNAEKEIETLKDKINTLEEETP